MKTKLQHKLAAIYGGIAIETIWTPDNTAQWDIEDYSLDQNDFTAWRSEIRASAIVNGQIITGSAYLGGTWDKYGDKPWESNPTISGYEPQMTVEALEELAVTSSLMAEPVKSLLESMKVPA